MVPLTILSKYNIFSALFLAATSLLPMSAISSASLLVKTFMRSGIGSKGPASVPLFLFFCRLQSFRQPTSYRLQAASCRYKDKSKYLAGNIRYNIVRLFFIIACFFSMAPAFAQNVDAAWKAFNEGSWEEARQICETLLQQTSLPDSTRADALSLKANILRRNFEVHPALKMHIQVLAIRKRLFGNQSPQAANSLINIGNCHTDLEQYELALAAFRQAVAIQNKILPVCHPARTLSENGLCRALTAGGFSNEALRVSDAMLQRLRACLGDEHPGLTPALLSAANARMENLAAGDLELAERWLKEALRIEQQQASNSLSLALIHQNLGNVYTRKGQTGEARTHFEQALSIAADLPNLPGHERSPFYFSAAGGLMDQGQFALSLGYLRQAYRLADMRQYRFRAETLNLTAICQRYLGNNEETVRLLETALNILKNKEVAQNPTLESGLYLNLGNCYSDRKDFSTALYFYKKAISLQSSSTSGCRPGTVRTLSKMGDVYLQQQQADRALAVFQEALNMPCLSVPLRAKLQLQTGEALHQMGRFEEALTACNQALEVLDFNILQQQPRYPLETLSALETRLSILFDQLHAEKANAASWKQLAQEYATAVQFFQTSELAGSEGENATILRATYHDLYAGLLEACYRAGDEKAAFFWAEQSKARQLKAGLRQPLSDELRKWKAQLADLEQQRMLYESQQHLWPQRFIEDLDARIWEIRRKYQAAKNAAPQQAPTALSPDELLKQVQQSLGKKEQLLHFSYGKTLLFVFQIGRQQFTTHPIVQTEVLEASAARLYQVWSTSPEFQPGKRDFAADGQALYRQLIQPLRLPAEAPLIIVPDGNLAYLPFEALLTETPAAPESFKNYPYLIHRHAISYREAALLPQVHRAKAPRRSLLAVAPDYRNHATGLPPLTFNTTEMESVAGIWSRSVALSASEATASRFSQLAPRHSILHISAHGVVNNQFPEFSFLAFSSTTDSAEAQVMYVSEMSLLSLSADLTVLSACQTARGPFFRGEGIFSMARAWLTAGSKSVAASLWNIDDYQTAGLMGHFHAHLKQGLRKDEALRQAKISMIQSGDHLRAHPYYWAGMVLHGDAEPIETQTAWWWWLIVLMAIMAVMSRLIKSNYLASFSTPQAAGY